MTLHRTHDPSRQPSKAKMVEASNFSEVKTSQPTVDVLFAQARKHLNYTFYLTIRDAV